ncbi:MAG: alpha/beta hydrolase [Halobacteriota archaeon]
MANARRTYTTGSVASTDGTVIGYRQLGSGPGVILIHGAVSSSQLFMKFGTMLSDSFTVYLPDRRGWGLSGPYGDYYSIQKEVEDLDALLKKTDAHNVFGLSIGAVIALQAALTLPSMRKVALYEPALDIDNSIVGVIIPFLPRFKREIAEDKVAEAMVTFIKNFAKEFEKKLLLLSILPRPLLAKFLSLYLWVEATTIKGDDVPFKELLPTFPYDHQLSVEMQGTLETFRVVDAEVLLLSGSKSSSSMRRTIDALSEVLPNAQHVALPGLGHEGPIDRADPKPVARELKSFFL